MPAANCASDMNEGLRTFAFVAGAHAGRPSFLLPPTTSGEVQGGLHASGNGPRLSLCSKRNSRYLIIECWYFA